MQSKILRSLGLFAAPLLFAVSFALERCSFPIHPCPSFCISSQLTLSEPLHLVSFSNPLLPVPQFQILHIYTLQPLLSHPSLMTGLIVSSSILFNFVLLWPLSDSLPSHPCHSAEEPGTMFLQKLRELTLRISTSVLSPLFPTGKLKTFTNLSPSIPIPNPTFTIVHDPPKAPVS